MAANVKDQYSNIVQVGVTQSAANTLTFNEVDMGLTIFQKVGLIISRVEVQLSSTVLALLAANTDRLQFGLTQSNQITSIGIQESAVLCQHEMIMQTIGTAASGFIVEDPYTFDFANLPGGGLLITPKPLYCAVSSANLGSAMTEIIFRLYFQIIELKAEEYFELLEARRFFGA